MPKWMGPFSATRMIGPVAMKLDLPKHMRCHNVFYSLRSNFTPSAKVKIQCNLLRIHMTLMALRELQAFEKPLVFPHPKISLCETPSAAFPQSEEMCG